MPLSLPARVPLAIGAIFRNEGPYILEWIAHHRLLGIEAIYICDNLSDDGSTELLAALDQAGVITHIPFPVPVAAQLPAYKKILREHGATAEWFALIDADEFIEPMQGQPALQDWLQALPADVGVVVINWLVFGSSGRLWAGSGPVTSRFLRGTSQPRGMNRYYKSILRPDAIKGFENPHHAPTKEGFRIVDSTGADLVVGEHTGLSKTKAWGIARLRHYMIKSKAEFIHKKMARGRATRADQLRDMDYFEKVDVGDTDYPMPQGYEARLLAEIEALRGRLGPVPHRIRYLDRSITRLAPRPRMAPGRLRRHARALLPLRARALLHRFWRWSKRLGKR